MPTSTVSFVDHWQILIGAALGPFLAIILSAIGFWLRSIYSSQKDKKESIRRVEISITRTLNDMYATRKKLKEFISRLRGLVVDARAITDSTTYFLAETNFPALREIFFDAGLPILKFGSPYLHNNLIFVDAGVKETNEWLKELKDNFNTLIGKNNFLLQVSPPATPPNQRTAYANNLENFANSLEDFSAFITIGIKMATQIKVYNLKLMKRRIMTIWKYEKAHLKYFKNKEELKKYRDWSKLLDRVNMMIEEEVNKELI